MKNLLLAVTVAVALAPCAARAQIIETSTPSPATSFEWKYTSDGSQIAALNAWTLHEVYFDLPFGLDFNAGHSLWLGTRTRVGQLDELRTTFGYEFYASKAIGGDGFFVKASLGAAVDGRETLFFGSLSGGWRS